MHTKSMNSYITKCVPVSPCALCAFFEDYFILKSWACSNKGPQEWVACRRFGCRLDCCGFGTVLGSRCWY